MTDTTNFETKRRARYQDPSLPALTVAAVVYALGRSMLQLPERSAAEMLAAPGPFEMLLSLAEAGGFQRVGDLILAIARPDTAHAYALASEAASSINIVAARAVLKHHGLDETLPLGPEPARKEPR